MILFFLSIFSSFFNKKDVLPKFLGPKITWRWFSYAETLGLLTLLLLNLLNCGTWCEVQISFSIMVLLLFFLLFFL